jgi:nitric-oxide synthase, bacterial
MLEQARQFLQQYSVENDLGDDYVSQRLATFERTGVVDYTFDELDYGAKLAWRNSNKCIGRLFWKSLKTFDQRHLETAVQIYEALLAHIDYATNGGKIRSTISVFAPHVRIWNHQLIRYAGYETDDGIIGDPASVDFTKICIELGWQGSGGRFDVLPLVIQIGDDAPQWFSIPQQHILEVDIVHPHFEWFNELGLKWYAVPMISDMQVNIGGIDYVSVPFNGWYMGTEIGARNLADENRYNMLPVIAEKMRLDTSANAYLWKDRALVELNVAVLYSYKQKGVSIVDHHTAVEQFLLFEKQEARQNRDVTGNWVWLVPPLSPATTEIYHRPLDNTKKDPRYKYQENGYKLSDRSKK